MPIRHLLPVLALVLVVGCTSGRWTSVPADLQGHWVGEGEQENPPGSWAVEITLMNDALDSGVVGHVAYPSIPCSGALYLAGRERGLLVFQEDITEGEDVCLDGGQLMLWREGEALRMAWTHVSGQAAATGTLYRAN